MADVANSVPNKSIVDDDEIFKSLNHKIRRNIIQTIGKKGELSFTEIKDSLGTIDSPALSYHLKSLNDLLDQKKGNYILTDVGNAAYLLINQVDQNKTHIKHIKHSKRSFMYSNIATIICWTIIASIIPTIIAPEISGTTRIWVVVILHIGAQINFLIMWFLWGYSWKDAIKKGTFIHDLMSPARYGDIKAFVQKLKDMGYEKVELIDTTNGLFMSKQEARKMMLGSSTLLIGQK